MSSPQYSLKRPHLILVILIAVLTILLLTFAAARNWFRDEPIRDILPAPVIAEPIQVEPAVKNLDHTNP